jgi:hypothetical protein
MSPAYKSPTVLAFSESLAVCRISEVASSQSLLNNGGIMPDVTMIIDLRVLFERGTGHPWIDKIFGSCPLNGLVDQRIGCFAFAWTAYDGQKIH